MMGEIQPSVFGVALIYSSQSDGTQLPVIIPDLGSCKDYDCENLPKSNPIEAQHHMNITCLHWLEKYIVKTKLLIKLFPA